MQISGLVHSVFTCIIVQKLESHVVYSKLNFSTDLFMLNILRECYVCKVQWHTCCKGIVKTQHICHSRDRRIVAWWTCTFWQKLNISWYIARHNECNLDIVTNEKKCINYVCYTVVYALHCWKPCLDCAFIHALETVLCFWLHSAVPLSSLLTRPWMQLLCSAAFAKHC